MRPPALTQITMSVTLSASRRSRASLSARAASRRRASVTSMEIPNIAMTSPFSSSSGLVWVRTTFSRPSRNRQGASTWTGSRVLTTCAIIWRIRTWSDPS